MADTEFEEFRHFVEELPPHIKATARTYTLAHDITLDEDSPSSNVNSNDNLYSKTCHQFHNDNGPGIATTNCSRSENITSSVAKPNAERKRRKLPEIPKNAIAFGTSLADELGDALKKIVCNSESLEIKPILMFNYLRNSNNYSPDSEQFDSGNSTAHSPDAFKSLSPQFIHDSFTSISPASSSNPPFTHIELLEATHRALHKFISRHGDELELEIGDPIYVQKESDDLWFEGINLRSRQHGIFPSAYVVDVEYNDFDATSPPSKKERFLINYLGSVETLYHKGNSVLCQAIHKIISTRYMPHSCILEVSDQGLRMLDKVKSKADKSVSIDYFYSLKNVSFCAFHPQDPHYMGFITKHPQCDRFACHVFQANESTRPVAESIGRAFHRFYQKYIETAYPIEDIYIE